MARNIGTHYLDGTSRGRTTHNDLEDEVARFLAEGGKITKLKQDDGSYDKALKKIEGRLGGGFNPFSKEDALSE